jgi:hypothetical protein
MMEHQELEQRTYEALEHARDAGLSEEDVSLLCWHCGIDSRLIIKEAQHEMAR